MDDFLKGSLFRALSKSRRRSSSGRLIAISTDALFADRQSHPTMRTKFYLNRDFSEYGFENGIDNEINILGDLLDDQYVEYVD